MQGLQKKTTSMIVAVLLILSLMPLWTTSPAAESEVFYSHTLSSVPVAGNNVLGSLTWNFSMAGNGTIEGGSSGRGARFAIGDNASHELIVKTTVSDKYISSIIVEAAMGSGSDTKLSITIGGKNVASDVAVSNVNNAYTFPVDGQSGEIVIRLSATVAGKMSYIKSISIYTGEPGSAAKTNYHNHTYRCRHAGSYTEKEYIEAAISNGFTAIGFSDHVMLPYITYENSVRGIYWEATEYYDTIRSLQDEYQGKIDILLGWESEWALGGLFEDYYKYLIENNLVDYLILGNHWQVFDTNNSRFITHIEDEAHELENVQNYVASAIEAFDTGLFTIMAHPEIFFVKGYGDVRHFTPEMKALVQEMCEKAKEKGVALELNQGYVSNMETLERYTEFWNIVKEVGNTVVIGVDAHYPGAYNESVRNRVLAFANKIGLSVTMDLGITRKTPKNVPIFLLEGQVEPTDANYVAIAKENLTWGSFRGLNASENAVTLPLSLPSSMKDCTITWSTDNPAVISNTGVVTRQNVDTLVTLTATISKGAAFDTKSFALTVLANGKHTESYLPDFIEFPSVWNSGTVVASTSDNKIVFTASSGGAYQNTKLKLSESIAIPESQWDDIYLVYSFDVAGGKAQITMSYTHNPTNTTVVNLGHLMTNSFEGSADLYHDGQTGKLSIRQIVDYINTRPDAGWGPIEAISGEFIVGEVTIWFSQPNTSVSFNEFRINAESKEPENKTLTVHAESGGLIKIENDILNGSSAKKLAMGSSVRVAAVSKEGYSFDGWYENGVLVSSDAEYTFTLNTDRTLTAKFKVAQDEKPGNESESSSETSSGEAESSSDSRTPPITGDTSAITLWFIGIVISLAGVAYIYRKRIA